jgi:hypothetical protein
MKSIFSLLSNEIIDEIWKIQTKLIQFKNIFFFKELYLVTFFSFLFNKAEPLVLFISKQLARNRKHSFLIGRLIKFYEIIFKETY